MVALGFVVAGTTSCKHPGSAKLEGHWRGTRAEGVTAAAQEAANTFATQTEIVAHGNLLTISTPQMPGAKGQQATYVVDDENKTTLVLHTDQDGPGNKETFGFGPDGKTMTWRLGDGQSIHFLKLKD